MKLSPGKTTPLPPRYTAADDTALAQAPLDRLVELVDDQVTRCLNHARQMFPALPAPHVWCDLRGKSAGQAHFGRKGLRFNPTLLKEQPRELLETVVPHEMAHWVVQYGLSARLKPHGREWQWIMVHMFGLPPRVTHQLDTGRASPAPYIYGCGCTQASGEPRRHHFSLRRHNRVHKGYRYQCRYCREELRYMGKEGQT